MVKLTRGGPRESGNEDEVSFFTLKVYPNHVFLYNDQRVDSRVGDYFAGVVFIISSLVRKKLMDRRTFLFTGLVAPFALKAGGTAMAAVNYNPDDESLTFNFADDPKAPKMTMWQLPNTEGPQMMGYVLRTDSGQTIVFDGGWKHNVPYLTELLKTRCGGKVDAWFLTHAHIDHCGALAEILTTAPESLEIKELYYNFPTQEWLDKYESGSKGDTKVIFDGLGKFEGAKKPQPGQIFEFGPLKIECLNDFDPEIQNNAINNSTIIYRLDVAGKSILILGDLGYEGGDRVLAAQKDKLDCDFCQMAHHGQQGVRRTFYEAVKPTFTLWPTPDWLWRNDNGKGDGSGPFKTCDTRIWAAELGVKEYYVSKNGLITLNF